jgi:hypothetical protein
MFLGKDCTYPQNLPVSPRRISCSSTRARVGTVRFVVAVFAHSLSDDGVGETRSIGRGREVVRAERIEVLGILNTTH